MTDVSNQPTGAPPAPGDSPSGIRVKPTEAIIGIAALVVAMGAFLPWVTAFVFSVAGTSGDGRITLVAAILGLLLLLARGTPNLFFPLQSILGCGTAAIGFYHLISIESSVPTELEGVAGAGTGLYLTALAGTVWALTALIAGGRYFLLRNRPASPPPPPSSTDPTPTPLPMVVQAAPPSTPPVAAQTRRVPRSVVIALGAFILGGGVATAVLLLSGGDSGQADTAVGTTTETASQPTEDTGSEPDPSGSSSQSGDSRPIRSFSTLPPSGTPDLGGLGFQSPTGNIRCMVQGAHATAIECMRRNDGLTVDLDATGPATVVPWQGDMPDLPTLAYGTTWGTTNPTFWCGSSAQGVECESGDSGRGFFLSRTAFEPLAR